MEEEKAIASFVSKIKSGLQDTSRPGEKIIDPEYINALGKRYRKTKITSPAELVAFLRVFTNLPAHDPFEWDDFPENVQNERAEKASATINLARAIIKELQETHSGYTPALRCIGFGDAARALSRVAREDVADRPIVGTTRAETKFPALAAQAISPLLFSGDRRFAEALATQARGADVFVSFPPEVAADALVADACREARALVYVSSTGVYPRLAGQVDASTPAGPDSPAGVARLAAEERYRAVGGMILRAPALYGATTGLHVRLAAGTYRLPGDGSGIVSRLHLDDLASFALAAFERGSRGATYLLGDALPAANREVVDYVCATLGLPLPASIPLAEAPLTLRGSRSIDASAAAAELGVTLRFPTYREGYAALGAGPGS